MKMYHSKILKLERIEEPTCECDGTIEGEDSGEAANVVKLAVGLMREDFATVAAKELDIFDVVSVVVV
ncbi:hypothetical protein Vadar_032810 [Vaccinium darrowii]|uniref:Uncharacterized protein n=1 Tax=Vaccinium darrowii TaxID=229202 RepID=A0ACB7ZP35_9ERIC|nr:hypothetical protein Vadar_032810 [Vaccinium darrowii]